MSDIGGPARHQSIVRRSLEVGTYSSSYASSITTGFDLSCWASMLLAGGISGVKVLSINPLKFSGVVRVVDLFAFLNNGAEGPCRFPKFILTSHSIPHIAEEWAPKLI